MSNSLSYDPLIALLYIKSCWAVAVACIVDAKSFSKGL